MPSSSDQKNEVNGTCGHKKLISAFNLCSFTLHQQNNFQIISINSALLINFVNIFYCFVFKEELHFVPVHNHIISIN